MSKRRAALALLLTAFALSACAKIPKPGTSPPATGTFPATGAVGAKGALRNVYPAGGVLTIRTKTTLSNVKIHGGLDIYADTTLNNVYVEPTGAWWGNVVVRNNAALLAQNCTIRPVMSATNPARGQDGVLGSSS